MKKIVVLLLTLLLVNGCASNPIASPSPIPDVKLNILAPKGATALPFIEVIQEDKHKVDLVDGSDLLATAFVNPNPEYDVIVAPSNLGAKLIADGKSEYKMLAVLTWGNLFLVGKENALEEAGILGAFGQAAVPSKILDGVNVDGKIKLPIEYFNAVADVQMQLLSNKVSVGLLAEPAASATIAKAKEKGTDLKILMDLQAEWQKVNKSESNGYPQAAIFVRTDSYAKNQAVIDQCMASVVKYLDAINKSENHALLVEGINDVKPETLGVPSSELTAKTWSNLNIHYKEANEVFDELKIFLKLFKIEKFDELLLK